MKERIWKTQNSYFATTNPGIYTGDRENEILFYGERESYWSGGHPYDDFDSIRYIFGTYYMHHVSSDRTAAGEDYYPFPFELLDKDASISFGELEAWCLRDHRTFTPISVYRRIGEFNTRKQGKWADEDIRFWEPDDRIRLLKPLVYTKYRIMDCGGFDKLFMCGKEHRSIRLTDQQFEADAAKGLIPEILYEKEPVEQTTVFF